MSEPGGQASVGRMLSTPRTSLTPFVSPTPTRPSLVGRPSIPSRASGSPLVRAVSVEERPGWKRIEAALAATVLTGVIEVIVASWILSMGLRDVLAGLLAQDSIGPGADLGNAIVVTWLARLGLVTAEAIASLAIAMVAGLVLLRCEIRPSVREATPFWARVIAVVRVVGLAIVISSTWKLGWSVLLASTTPWLLLVLAGLQLVALVTASVRPQRPT
ncbi:MAG: hypothetical protein NVS3B10_22300 [Polyangiales bacterium]